MRIDSHAQILVGILSTALLLLFIESFVNIEFAIVLTFVPLFFSMQGMKSLTGKQAATQLSFIMLLLFIWQLYSMRWLIGAGLQVPFVLSLYYSSSLLIPFLLFYICSRQIMWVRWLLFISAWLIVELLHCESELGVSTQALGYYFHGVEVCIQWYALTGFIGGSLLILVTNILAAAFIHSVKIFGLSAGSMARIGAFGFLLVIVVCVGHFSKTDVDSKINISVLHTALDPKGEKYKLSVDETFNKYRQVISEDGNPDSINLVVLPENALPTLGWVADLGDLSSSSYASLNVFHGQLNGAKILTGGIMFEQASSRLRNDIPLANEHYGNDVGNYYAYNTALFYNEPYWAFRTKKNLVPFEEYSVRGGLGGGLQKVFRSLGSFEFSIRDQKAVPLVYENMAIGPIICFEITKYKTVTEMVTNGANVLALLLNEGWYDSDKGASVFHRIAKIRSIETNRSIAKSSNMGFSGKISPTGNGDLINNNRHVSEVITSDYNLNYNLTWFVRHGKEFYFFVKVTGLIVIALGVGTDIVNRRKKRQRS